MSLTLLLGAALGAINGTLVSLLRVVPFIVTLGTMTVYLGAAKMLAEKVDGGQTVRPAAYAPSDPNFSKKQVRCGCSGLPVCAITPCGRRGFDRRSCTTAGPLDEALDWGRYPVSIGLVR